MTSLSAAQLSALSLGYLTLPGAGPIEVIEAARASGLGRAGLRIAGRLPHDAGLWAANDADLCQAIASRAAAYGIAVDNVAAHYVGPGVSHADFAPVLETAAALGARWLCTSGYDPDTARLAGSLAALAKTARPYRLGVALEFVPYSELRTLEAASQILDRAESDGLAILVDAMHFVRSGSSLEALAGLRADQVAFFQLCDGAAMTPPGMSLPQEARTARLLPGEGAFPLPAMLAALPPETPLEIEVPAARLSALPLDEQAREAVGSVRAFLSGHAVRRM